MGIERLIRIRKRQQERARFIAPVFLLKYPGQGKYAYCVRHAGELIEELERETKEEAEPVGIDDTNTDDDFTVGRF